MESKKIDVVLSSETSGVQISVIIEPLRSKPSQANPGAYLERRRRGRGTTIERDPEMEAYLQTVDRYLTIKELRQLLVNRFGEKRAPSKSSIDRYLQHLKKIRDPKKG